MPTGVGDLFTATMFFVGLLALVAGFLRHQAASGHGDTYLNYAGLIEGLALALIAIVTVALVNSVRIEGVDESSLLARLRRFGQRQRMNLLGVLALAVALTVVEQTSGQAIDSLRTWSIDSGAHGWGRLAFGIAAAWLLALLVYETGLWLTQAAATPSDDLPAVDRRVWFSIGVALLVGGIIAAAFAPVGYGLIVIGLILLLLGFMELPRLERKKRAGRAELTAPVGEHAAEWVATVPLVALAATGVTAAIDAGLSTGVRWEALAPLIPAAILAGVAVLMTCEAASPQMEKPSTRAVVSGTAAVVVGTFGLVLVVRNEIAIAVFGSLISIGLLVYTLMVFRSPKRDDDESKGPPAPKRQQALSLPWTLAAGASVFFAVHLDVFGTGDVLGTVALVCIALAFLLALFYFAVRGSLRFRPPRVLWWLGVDQLPILTLLIVAWIAVGAIRPPPTLHEARLVDRQQVQGASGNGPSLRAAFTEWVAAQPELQAGSARSTEPLPMFLVASHGGGIRAAYWTAIALDCIVGVSATGADEVTAETETCEKPRRAHPEQQAAARRIFIASGVSGGGVGLHVYARQLLSGATFGDGGWVDERMGGDFASPTVAWALFHDFPNHFLGLNSERGGTCTVELRGQCLTGDRAQILEETFDRAALPGKFEPLLRLTWDMRSSSDKAARTIAETIPLLIVNSTVTGGKARAVVSAGNLGTWPDPEVRDPQRGAFDDRPLAGTAEVSDAMCASKDIRLSTAAVLGSRFPYVSPSGHLSGRCRRSIDEPIGADDAYSRCARVQATTCEMGLVDGGYAENSGLFTIGALWPSLRELVVNYNRTAKRPIAPVIVEIDNHYRAPTEAELAATGSRKESLIPILTALGARTAMETYARSLVYRLRPPQCTVTISPGLHPGLTAPLGWELSQAARDELRAGLTRPRPATKTTAIQESPAHQLRRLQQWIAAGSEPDPDLKPDLVRCVPHDAIVATP